MEDTMRNKKTGEEMTTTQFANKMLNDIFQSYWRGEIDVLKLDRYLWEVEDFCKENGLHYYKPPMSYQIEIY